MPLQAVGGGHPVESGRAQAEAAAAATGSTSPSWQRREPRPQWGRTGSRQDSLEVPTFLRRNMD
jgi:hypothetical protein